jgi:hypothetical protein
MEHRKNQQDLSRPICGPGLHAQFILLAQLTLTWKMEAAIHSSKISVDFCQTTWQYKPEDQTLFFFGGVGLSP